MKGIIKYEYNTFCPLPQEINWTGKLCPFLSIPKFNIDQASYAEEASSWLSPIGYLSMKIILIKQPKNKITIAKMLKIFALKKEIVYEIFCDLFLFNSLFLFFINWLTTENIGMAQNKIEIKLVNKIFINNCNPFFKKYH